jgi:hypothetical protein
MKAIKLKVIVEIKVKESNILKCGTGADGNGSQQCHGIATRNGLLVCKVFPVMKKDKKGRDYTPTNRVLEKVVGSNYEVLRCKECLDAVIT